LWRLLETKNIISRCTLWHFKKYSLLLTKDSRNEIRYDFQPPFSLHISNSRTKPVGLDI
jgi:hypothetical protein